VSNTLSQRTLGNATALAIGAAAETVLQLAFLILAGRQLGPEEFGFYGYVLAILTFVSTAAHYGLTVISVRELSQRPADEVSIFAATFRIRAGLSLAFFIAAIIVAAFTPLTDVHRSAVWIMFAYLLFQPFDLSLLFDAHKLSRWDVPGKIAGRLVSVGLLFTLWQIKGGITVADVAICSSLLMLVNVLIGWIAARGQGLSLKLFAPTRDTRRLLRESAPVVWSNLLVLAYSQIQTVFVKWFSTDLETGFSALASRLIMPILIFKGILYRVFLPLISESAADREVFTERLEKIFPALSLIFMPMAALGIPAVQVLLVPLFGAEYAGAVLPLQIILSHLIFTGMGSLFGTALLAAGDTRTPMIGLTVGCVISLGCSILLIPHYGAVGAAWGTWLGEVISCGYALVKFVTVFRPRIYGRMLRIAAASLASTAAFYMLNIFFSLPGGYGLIISAVVLIAALRVIGEISPDRLRAWRSLIAGKSPEASNE